MAVLDHATEQDVKRQVCEAYRDDDLQPDEVIVGADGTVTIDRRARKPWAEPMLAGHWNRNAAAAPPAERNTAMTETAPGGARPARRRQAGAAAGWDDPLPGQDPAAGWDDPLPAPRAAHRVPPGWGTSGPWARLAADTAGFEPEDDGELLGWMAAEAAGMSGYGESLAEVYETVTSAVGVDPAALAALHDCAEDVAGAAAAMETARARFAAHYSEPREYAASGGVLPHDGRWVTGEGD
jgi:hypothetical protein